MRRFPNFKIVCAWITVLSVMSSSASAITSRKLVESLPALADIETDFKIGPEGSWVAYRADQDLDEVFELYCVDLVDGGTNKLNLALGASDDVGSWQLSADGSLAIYWVNVQGGEMREVYSAATAGGGGAKLNSPLVRPGSIGGGLARDRAVFIASERQSVFFEPYFELFSVPAAGGSVELLNGPLVNGGGIRTVVTRTDSDLVLYLADQEVMARLCVGLL